MKISSILAKAQPSVSFEVFPPKKDRPLEGTKELVGGTTGANTCAIAEHVQKTCGVPVLAHLTCVAATRESIDREVASFRAAGIENILCLRGDLAPETVFPGDSAFSHASDLVAALAGKGFCLGGACYPEGHPESPHFADDIAHVKEKVDAGLDFLTTQMFFDNNVFFHYLARLREKEKVDAGLDFLTTQMFFDNNVFFHYLARLRDAGVTVPVVAGIMPVTNGRQIARICELSGTHLPPRFRAIVDRFGDDPAAMLGAGVAYATEQIVDLFANGVNHVHVYTMNKPELARRIMDNLKGIVA